MEVKRYQLSEILFNSETAPKELVSLNDFDALRREWNLLEQKYKEALNNVMLERDQAHDSGLEAAAKLCDQSAVFDYSGNSACLARDIRAMKRGGK